MAKKETITIERTYNVPLRKEYRKVPRWQRTKKAVSALRQFLAKHMKSDNVKISKELNQKVWKHGIKNPPHHVKITVTKDSEGLVKADLFGEKKGKKKSSKPIAKKEEVKTEEKKEEPKTEEVEKVEAPVEEKKEEVKEETKSEASEEEVKTEEAKKE
jgi:large subunit ribosomal protein L31e